MSDCCSCCAVPAPLLPQPGETSSRAAGACPHLCAHATAPRRLLRHGAITCACPLRHHIRVAKCTFASEHHSAHALSSFLPSMRSFHFIQHACSMHVLHIMHMQRSMHVLHIMHRQQACQLQCTTLHLLTCCCRLSGQGTGGSMRGAHDPRVPHAVHRTQARDCAAHSADACLGSPVPWRGGNSSSGSSSRTVRSTTVCQLSTGRHSGGCEPRTGSGEQPAAQRPAAGTPQSVLSSY